MKIDITYQERDRTLYQLWGCDSFTNDVYYCGIYRHRTSAYRAKRKLEQIASKEGVDLRDTFWIVPVTESGFMSQKKNRKQEMEAKNDLKKVNQTFVNRYAAIISNNLQRLTSDKELEAMLRKRIRTKNDYDKQKLLEIPEDLMIESIYVFIKKHEGKYQYSFYLGISTKDVPFASKSGTTHCYLCSGDFETFRKQVKESASPEWVRTVLNRIVEKNIYETY